MDFSFKNSLVFFTAYSVTFTLAYFLMRYIPSIKPYIGLLLGFFVGYSITDQQKLESTEKFKKNCLKLKEWFQSIFNKTTDLE